MLPTIPEYYKRFINKSKDLELEPKQCCPFHKEDTPSFSYSQSKGVWRCFGGCKIGGDVVDLHRYNFKIKDRESAKESLYKLYGIKYEKRIQQTQQIIPNKERELENYYLGLSDSLCKTVADYLELDYIMSKYPIEQMELKDFILQRGGKV